MGVYDGTFILPPPPFEFNYCLDPQPRQSYYQSTLPPTELFFFSRVPFENIAEVFFSH